MEWSADCTRELVHYVNDCDDPVAVACIVMGAMAGVLVHNEGIDMASEVLAGFSNDVAVQLIRLPAGPDDEGDGNADS
jgi:hypothetical protein